MRLEPREIVQTCSNHYNIWKEEALRARSPEEIERFLEKAFFWLELQNNLLILWTIEKTMGTNSSVKLKLEEAQLNVNKKIVDYASKVLKELGNLK
jgi:hypothetical protein